MKYILCSIVGTFVIFSFHLCVIAALKELLMSLIAFHSINSRLFFSCLQLFILDLSLIIGLPIFKKLLTINLFFGIFFRILTHPLTRNLRTLLFVGFSFIVTEFRFILLSDDHFNHSTIKDFFYPVK